MSRKIGTRATSLLALGILPAALSTLALAALAVFLLTLPAAARDRAGGCFEAVRNIDGPRLVCTHKAWMTDQEKADFKKLTRGYLLDAKCVVSVDVARELVEEGLAASDRSIDVPPQPVVCALETSRGPMEIKGTFAPHVVFKDGFAVDATPGLANITGVNSYLAWPVVAYVNSATSIKSAMADIINAFRGNTPTGKQAAR